jgi:hypothetical protein
MADMRNQREAAETAGTIPAKAPIVAMLFLICAAVATGCGHSSTSGSGAGGATETAGGTSSNSGNDQAAANALKTTPLTEADIDLYLDIMKAAADRVTNATGQDRAALDLLRQVNSGKTTGALTPDQAALLAHAAQLTQVDEDIAAQRGVKSRYDAIRGVIEGLVGTMACASCSGDGGAQAASAAQQQEWAAEQAVMQTDQKLLQPHSAEIVSLQKQVRGFLTNQPAND